MEKANYGIDAPGVIRNLIMASLVGFIFAVFLPIVQIGNLILNLSGFFWMGVSCGLMAIWMLVYSKYGKLKHRDRMINLVNWKGNEQVLDIGTGRGLMMIAAAKKLTTGKCTGIDVWNEEDLTNNKMENTFENVKLEGVVNKTEIKNDNAKQLSFNDNTFDVILTNLCLHNIYDKEGRKKACDEICRVLKPGGKGIISDFTHMREYKNNFEANGMKIEVLPAAWFTTFPPLSIIVIEKQQ